MKNSQQLDRFARAHHGLITQDSWVEAGNSRSAWFRHASGLLEPCGPGVARFLGSAKSPEQRILAAVLASTNTVASHRSAAYLWGADIVGDDPVDLIQTGRSSATKLDGVVIHKPRDLDELRPVPREGCIPVTNPTRTLLDLGAVAPHSVVPALESLLISGVVTVPGVTRTLFQHRERGRNGVTALREAIEGLTLGSKPPDSVLETAMGKLLDRAGIGGWVFHHRVIGIELDFAFPAQRVDVEVDGWASHAKRAQFERDRERDAELAAVGWHVMRFTWRQVTRRPEWVVSRVRSVLSDRSVPVWSLPVP